jgi:uncharacterized protein YjeT (DUF2065 family)
MRMIVLVIAALLIALGLTGVLYPEGLTGLLKYSFSPTGIIVVGIARIVVGVLLFLAARGSSIANTVRVIAALIVVAGIAGLFLSPERAQSLASSFLENGPDRLRIIACLPLAVGLFIGGSALFHRPRR